MKISSINTYTNYNKNIKQTNRSYFNHIAFGATVIDKYDMHTVTNSDDISNAIKERDFKTAYAIMTKLEDNYDPNWTDSNGVPLLLQIAEVKPRFPFLKFSKEQIILRESIMRDLIAHPNFIANQHFDLTDKKGIRTQTSYLDEAVLKGNIDLLLMLSQYAVGLKDPHDDFFSTLIDKAYANGNNPNVKLILNDLQDKTVQSDINNNDADDTDDDINNTKVTKENDKEKKVNKSGAALLDGAKVDVSSDSIPASLDEVGGLSKAKKDIENFIIKPWSEGIREKLQKNNIAMPNGILLYGPPGTGKTYVASVISKQTGYPMYLIMLGSIGSQFVSGTANNIFDIFEELENRYKATGKPSILFLDELDDMGGSRDDNFSSAKKEDTNNLLAAMNNAANRGIILIGATNYIDGLDQAVMRSGRLDKKIELTLPDKEERKSILAKIMERKDITKNLLEHLDTLADLTDGKSPADIANYINTAAREAVYNNQEEVSIDDFKRIIKDMSSQTKKSKIGFSRD